MPAQNKFEDVERFRAVQETSLQMLTEMHGALSEISKSDNPAQMKSIAVKTLDNVQNIAFNRPLVGGKHNAKA